MAFDDLLAALRDPPPLLRELQRIPGLYIVGGWLRRAWRGEHSSDLDLISELPLDETLPLITAVTGAEAFALNERFATRRIVAGEYTLDISAMADGGLDTDLARRDYTVNTLAAELSRLGPGFQQLDLHGHYLALPDLRDGALRMVERANLEADPLRILRGYRLCAAEGFSPDDATASAWRELAGLAATPAAERIHEELLRWFAAPGMAEALRRCADDGVLWELLPPLRELTQCRNQADGSVWDHTLECLRQLDVLLAELPEPLQPYRDDLLAAWAAPVSGMASAGTLTRLGLLLHDVAKPQTREDHEDGRTTFYKHQEVGAELAEPLLARLKFSNDEMQYVLLLIREHLRLGYYSDHDPVPRRLIYRYLRRLGNAAPLMLLHSIADCAATEADWAVDAYIQHVRAAAEILQQYYGDGAVARPPVLLDGAQIMALLGIRPGKLVGQLKDALLEATAAGEVSSAAEAAQFVRAEAQRIRDSEAEALD